MSLSLFIARRYFASKDRYLFVSFLNFVAILGVALGVFAMVVVLSAMCGFSKDLEEKLLGLNSHIRVVNKYSRGMDVQEFKSILEKTFPEGKIRDVQKYVEGEIIIQREGETSESAMGAKVRGLNFDELWKIPSLKFWFPPANEGTDFAEGAKELPEIILGSELLLLMSVQPEFGDILRLTAPFGGIDPLGNVVPNMGLFRLKGGFKSGYYNYDSKYVLMSLEDARRILGAQGREGFFIWLKKSSEAKEVALRLKEELGGDYDVQSWEVENKKLFRALKLEKIGMSLLLILIIMIASFGVVSVILMLVFSKQKDIGMLSALGIQKRSIERIFLLKGMMIGVIGTLLGAAAGVGVSFLLKNFKVKLPASYYLDYLPFDVRPWQVLLISVLGVIIALVASFYPARQAMRVNTTTVLRYE